MSWEWRIFCTKTTTGERIATCLGSGSDQTYLNWILEAWAWTMVVALISLVIAMATGLVVGTLRTLVNSPFLSRLACIWVELFRSIPLLVQVFLALLPCFVCSRYRATEGGGWTD